ncbi:unnamed protein product [Cuscuta europaea]|uniref:Retrotransposon Copia-like N-terminal domain-containing protein n=1 Tax=Cuscuta europaea TaxID=41803 RepID=A0A9P1EHR7_CUSEU|nr:unnamed protein product [Cuscuta europaea]
MANGKENEDGGASSIKIDHTSPYYLGPQDRPGDYITPIRLHGENYDDWAGSVRLALKARRKFVFLDGSIKTYENHCTEEDWQTIHSMLVSWLMNTIAPEVRSTLSQYEDAKLLWEDLKERFSVVDGPRIHQLKVNIARCEQSPSMTVANYYGQLKMWWDELNNYEPLLSCTCGKCTCKLGELHAQRRESERFHQFLMGLTPDFYAQIRSNLLSQEPLPTLNRAYHQITQEERVRGTAQKKEEKPEIMGFAAKAVGRENNKASKVDKSGMVCTHCNFPGHEITGCFQLIGYPDWWGNRPRGIIKGTGQGKSGTGRGSVAVTAHAAASEHIIPQCSSQKEGEASATTLPGFTAEQWRALTAAFGKNSASSDHMTGPTLEEADWNG